MTSTTLRAVTHRLTTTPVDQLPSIASFLATSLSDCAELLSTPQAQKSGKFESDNAVQVHKLKTRLASLLQDRSVEGRWTAVVLAKAAVEAGQWEILRGYEPIVRSLIGVLAKPDPASTRKMCIITLTRIFHLTYQYPTLVREITTPHLPGFITAALNLISVLVKLPSGSSRKAKVNSPFTETVLHAVLELMPRHPTIFRPFGLQLRSLLTEIIGSSPPAYFPGPVVDVAEQVFSSLHKCAPKDKAGTGWSDDCRSTILSIHRTADHVFRAVVEQWESVDTTLAPARQTLSKEVADDGPDSLRFPGWKGIHSGTDRIVVLLRILSRFISMPSAAPVALPLGTILDLTSRLTSVTAPLDSAEGSQSGVQVNSQIGREEREMLWIELPRIHIASMDLLEHVASVLDKSATSITQTMLEQVTWVFRNEKSCRDIRSATYNLLTILVKLNGPSMTKQSVSPISHVLHSACVDILPSSGSGIESNSVDSKTKKGGQTTANADSFLNPELQKNRLSQSGSRSTELRQAASDFLQSVLVSVPSDLVAASTRAEVDRTIILTADKDAMLASVLNPIPATKGRGAAASIMPFLVQGYSDQMEVEALVRPRMPVLITAPELDACAEMDEEEADEIADEAYHAASETTGFLKEPVATPVETEKQRSPPVTDPGAHLQKRTYVEESSLPPSSLPAKSESQPAQNKKARFEETVSTPKGDPVVVTQSSTVASQSAQTVSSNPRSETQVTSQVTTTAGPQAAADAQLSADESDDELPALNIDSDTDEEDDEDVTMDG
ncbi:hypothetical protein N7492_000352 [Penicillium capsulatum]|uniref:Pre-rRNA-processing protein RIX1 n=1 Tax=Penicillium capsulatum TaxID=69766 RepID=A0A9W9ISN1_9EURO|nr:hypothetical protein N7492_000352 [Penicillium capsulatum]KAJ6130584.1 hypothetical protein N7512_003364 [Penicillium capsulatum]